MPFDRVKNQRKNFCFITYDNENVVFDLLKTPKQVINGKEVDVKKATPKPENFGPPAMRGGRGGPGGMRGAPRGRGKLISVEKFMWPRRTVAFVNRLGRTRWLPCRLRLQVSHQVLVS